MGVPLGRRYSRPELSKEAGTREMSVELLVCGCQRTVNIDGARAGKEMRTTLYFFLSFTMSNRKF